MKPLITAAAALAASICVAARPVVAQPDWRHAVEQSLGHGEAKEHQVFEIEAPRSDLKIERAGLRLDPGLDFTDELRFMPAPGGALVMGEIILTADEANPVISRLESRGFQVAAVHKHILDLSPRLVWVHFNATGEPSRLAQSIRYALAASKTPLPAKAGAPSGKSPGLDSARIEQALGRKGKPKDGLLTFSIPVDASVSMDGVKLPSDMGMSIELNFQPLGGGRAAVTGEFPLTADKVNPVLRALQDHGLQVQAVHNHMLTEQPRMFFVHFWAEDEATAIAQSLRAAVDLASSRPGA